MLEDAELEVMERLETAPSPRQGELEEQARGLDAELGRRSPSAGTQRVAAIDDEADVEQSARADAAAGVPGDLLALYEKIRDASGGVGAARLYQRRCEGCRLELTPADLGRIRAAGEDAVLRCEECGRILVRTADSGSVTAGGRLLVVEADGGSRGNPGPAGYGAVVKDAAAGGCSPSWPRPSGRRRTTSPSTAG